MVIAILLSAAIGAMLTGAQILIQNVRRKHTHQREVDKLAAEWLARSCGPHVRVYLSKDN